MARKKLPATDILSTLLRGIARNGVGVRLDYAADQWLCALDGKLYGQGRTPTKAVAEALSAWKARDVG